MGMADDEEPGPWQGAINLLFWIGAILFANLFCWAGQCCRGEDSIKCSAAGMAVSVTIGAGLFAVWMWLGITKVNW